MDNFHAFGGPEIGQRHSNISRIVSVDCDTSGGRPTDLIAEPEHERPDHGRQNHGYRNHEYDSDYGTDRPIVVLKCCFEVH